MSTNNSIYANQEKIFKEKTGFEFISMYNKYYPRLMYYTYKICNDKQKAQDISTDSFIIALNKIDKYEKDKSQFSTWLFTIAKNLSLQELKNDNKSISVDRPYFGIDGSLHFMDEFLKQDDDNIDIIHDISYKKAQIIKKHINNLKEPYRTVIIMREMNKMSYKDISDRLGRNLSTIKSQIRNGRLLLIEQSKKEFNSIDEYYE